MKNISILLLSILIFSSCENFDDPIPDGSVLQTPRLSTKLIGEDKVLLTWTFEQFCAGFCPTTVPPTYYEIWTKSLSSSTNYKLAEAPAGEMTFLVEGLEPGVRQEFFVIAKRADVSNKTNRVMVVPDELPAPNTIFENEGFNYITHPQISPDGEQIAYTTPNAEANIIVHNVFLYDFQSNSQRLLYDNGQYPSWSSSGEKLVFVTEAQNTSAIKEITIASGNVKEYARDSFQSYFPVFGAADSTMLYFLDSLSEGESGIVEFEVIEDTLRLIREEEFLEYAQVPVIGADYLAEESTLAYSKAFPKETSIGFSYDLVGFDLGSPSALRNLEVSDWNDSNPSFSRENSALLAFISDRSGLPQVWIKNLSSGSLIQVTDIQENERVNSGIAGLSWSGENLYVNTQNSEGITKLVEIDVSALLGD